MLFMASPMIVLYFASVGVAFMFDRKKKENLPGWLDLPDDQASAL
jgi:sec-independent protein translocase protein TatC